MEKIVDKGIPFFKLLDIKKDSMLLIKTLIGHIKKRKSCLTFIINSEINGLLYQGR